MDFKNISKKYRPVPFWSWNEKLDTDETRRQVGIMNDVGMGGYFMHARGGLATEYLGEEWFNNVEAAIEEGEALGLSSWAYDENGWPSGFGDGFVNGKGVEFQQKALKFETELIHTETAIAKNGELYFYYEPNPFYVDLLDKRVVAEFIDYAYKPYYEKFGNRFEGFFTDEPQVKNGGIPWSFVFEEEYEKRYNEDIKEHLEELFFEKGDYKQTRIKFWKMITDLFSESYFKQIFDWCQARDLKLTGHLFCEEDVFCQTGGNGACMPHYEYFHIPGMDWLGRDIKDCLTVEQLTSACAQLGKSGVLTETFALCGHNVSLAELKGIFEWQAVKGVNLLCQHLEGYSLRGIRKRDYPPAMYYQQPWWSAYDKWIDAMSRIGMIIQNTKAEPRVLVIHPQTTAWSEFNGEYNSRLLDINNKLLNTIKTLNRKHIPFHLGDETLIERHARVENGRFIVGEQGYDILITENCEILLPATEAIINEFVNQGGVVKTSENLPENNVVSLSDITYSKRFAEDFKVHYFVNTSADEKQAHINVKGKKLNIYTGELEDFDGEHSFEPWGSLMVIEDSSENVPYVSKAITDINLSSEFKVSDNTQNAITLDYCDYYFDGVLQEKNGYVLNIAERLNALCHAVKVHQDYKINIEHSPRILYLVTESPQQFDISVNGRKIDKEICGFFRDKSFKKIDITDYLTIGENIISFDCDFCQSEKFYESYKNAHIFETEKNKLSYDMEIEAVYLVGDFGVATDGEWKKSGTDAYFYKGDFKLKELPQNITLDNIEQQGFPFFCGELELEGKIQVRGEHPVLNLDFKGVSAVKIKIGDYERTVITDKKISLEGLNEGEHAVTLTLINNLRNLLGPHHLNTGECLSVCPGHFYKEKCLWFDVWTEPKKEDRWTDDYCFVEFGRR